MFYAVAANKEGKLEQWGAHNTRQGCLHLAEENIYNTYRENARKRSTLYAKLAVLSEEEAKVKGVA